MPLFSTLPRSDCEKAKIKYMVAENHKISTRYVILQESMPNGKLKILELAIPIATTYPHQTMEQIHSKKPASNTKQVSKRCRYTIDAHLRPKQQFLRPHFVIPSSTHSVSPCAHTVFRKTTGSRRAPEPALFHRTPSYLPPLSHQRARTLKAPRARDFRRPGYRGELP